MNKRQAKKHNKKLDAFAISFATSYKEVKEFDRAYHEFVLQSRRAQRAGKGYLLEEFKFEGTTDGW